jgi:hypothetical protein
MNKLQPGTDLVIMRLLEIENYRASDNLQYLKQEFRKFATTDAVWTLLTSGDYAPYAYTVWNLLFNHNNSYVSNPHMHTLFTKLMNYPRNKLPKEVVDDLFHLRYKKNWLLDTE